MRPVCKKPQYFSLLNKNNNFNKRKTLGTIQLDFNNVFFPTSANYGNVVSVLSPLDVDVISIKLKDCLYRVIIYSTLSRWKGISESDDGREHILRKVTDDTSWREVESLMFSFFLCFKHKIWIQNTPDDFRKSEINKMKNNAGKYETLHLTWKTQNT